MREIARAPNQSTGGGSRRWHSVSLLFLVLLFFTLFLSSSSSLLSHHSCYHPRPPLSTPATISDMNNTSRTPASRTRDAALGGRGALMSTPPVVCVSRYPSSLAVKQLTPLSRQLTMLYVEAPKATNDPCNKKSETVPEK